MRKFLAACLIAILIMSLIAPCVFAAPEVIKKDTIDLKADTFIVWECKNGSYGIEYINSGAGDSYGCTKIFPSNHSSRLGGYAILKVGITSVKNAAECNLKFSFDTGDNIDHSVMVYCANYSDGEKLIADLTPDNFKNVSNRPYICSGLPEKTIYQVDKTVSSVENVNVEISTAESTVLKNHINTAINNGEGSVYFLISGKAGASGINSDGSYFQLYNSASADKAPTLSVTGSAVSSEVELSETGYTVKVAGLESYTDNALVVVTAFDSEDSLIQTSASGQAAANDTSVDVDVPCKDASKMKLYIWKAGTLEPITYPETIFLD